MATTVKEGNFIYHINPDKPTELQRAPMGSNSWSFVCGCNGAQIFDIITKGERHHHEYLHGYLCSLA